MKDHLKTGFNQNELDSVISNKEYTALIIVSASFGQLGLFRRGESCIRPYYCLMAAIHG